MKFKPLQSGSKVESANIRPDYRATRYRTFKVVHVFLQVVVFSPTPNGRIQLTMSLCATLPHPKPVLQTGNQPSKNVQNEDVNRHVTNPDSPVEYSAFDTKSKRCIVLLCALAGFFSPFSAFTYFPALEYVGSDLGVSLQLMNLSITVFLVIQAIAPPLLGDMADQIGRRPVYLLVLFVYVVACLGLALQRSYPALLVFRMVQSFGSSGTLSFRNQECLATHGC